MIVSPSQCSCSVDVVFFYYWLDLPLTCDEAWFTFGCFTAIWIDPHRTSRLSRQWIPCVWTFEFLEWKQRHDSEHIFSVDGSNRAWTPRTYRRHASHFFIDFVCSLLWNHGCCFLPNICVLTYLSRVEKPCLPQRQVQDTSCSSEERSTTLLNKISRRN